LKHKLKQSKEFVEVVQMKSGQCWTELSPWTSWLHLCIVHARERKQQFKHWLTKGTPRPVEAKVHVTRTKTMVLVFFNSRGMVYTNYVPKGKFHCWSPEDLPEAFEEEDARDGGRGVVPPL
jgi:hypothetical protein